MNADDRTLPVRESDGREFTRDELVALGFCGDLVDGEAPAGAHSDGRDWHLPQLGEWHDEDGEKVRNCNWPDCRQYETIVSRRRSGGGTVSVLRPGTSDRQPMKESP